MVTLDETEELLEKSLFLPLLISCTPMAIKVRGSKFFLTVLVQVLIGPPVVVDDEKRA